MPAPPSSTGASAETLLGVYRAEDYGAHGGADDSSGGINLAIFVASQNGGGVVMLDSGLTYRVRRTVTLLANVELVLPTGTVLQAAGALGGDVVQASGAAGVRLSGGGTIDGNRGGGGQTAGNGVTLTGCTEPQVEEVSIQNCYQDGLALTNCTRPVLDVVCGANGRHGVYHSGTTFGRGQITARDNGQRVAGSGVTFDATSTDNVYAPLVSTDSRAGGAKTQQYGVLEVAASGCDRNVYAGQALGGNATATQSLVGPNSGLQAGAPTGAAGGGLAGTYPNPTIAAGAVADAQVAAGAAIAASKLAAGITNAQLAADVARANQLVNGGFENWQRGTSFTTGWTADRWYFSPGTGSSATISKDTANYDVDSSACAAVAYTQGTANSNFDQPVEVNGTGLRGKPITFSIRIKSLAAIAGGVTLQIIDSDGSTFVAQGTAQNTTAAYQTFSVTGTPAATTAGGKITCRVLFSVSGTYYLDNAMLVPGSVAADYVPLPPADDLARCLRYYETLGGILGWPQFVTYMAAGQGAVMSLPFKARKVVTPTVTKVGTWTVINCAQPTVPNAHVDGCNIAVTATATGQVGTYPADATGSITAEANP